MEDLVWIWNGNRCLIGFWLIDFLLVSRLRFLVLLGGLLGRTRGLYSLLVHFCDIVTYLFLPLRFLLPILSDVL